MRSEVPYTRAAAKYQPARTDVLFVAEAPPQNIDRYFYFENVKQNDWLWIALMKALYPSEWGHAKSERQRKKYWLLKFQRDGFQLIDAVKVSASGSDREKVSLIASVAPQVIKEIQKIGPRQIVLIKATVHEALFEPFVGAGLPVVNETPLPFPSFGRQAVFHRELRRIIDTGVLRFQGGERALSPQLATLPKELHQTGAGPSEESSVTIYSLSEFVSHVSELRDDWYPNEETWGPWFRGQTDASWALVPGFYRRWPNASVVPRGHRNLEDELRQEFVVRAPSFTELKPLTSWGWYFLMQHSSAPTRLLDWTEGALIALYFAIKDSKSKIDAAVWALDPWWLNEEALQRSEVYCPEMTQVMSQKDLSRYKPWLPELFTRTYELPPLPVAVYPAYSAQRISTQRSCFTIHGSQISAFEELSRGAEPGLTKIVIAASAVKTIRKELLTCGVDELAIYPDLDGLGRCLSAVLRMETGD